ncbi:MAG: hypothetical protein ACXV2J_05400 [Actinomycetes bacterium]
MLGAMQPGRPGHPVWFENAEFLRFRQWYREETERLARDAQRQVSRSARGRSVAEVQADFEGALRARGVTLPAETTAWLSCLMADPYWWLKHPLLAMRRQRERRIREWEDDGPSRHGRGDEERSAG